MEVAHQHLLLMEVLLIILQIPGELILTNLFLNGMNFIPLMYIKHIALQAHDLGHLFHNGSRRRTRKTNCFIIIANTI